MGLFLLNNIYKYKLMSFPKLRIIALIIIILSSSPVFALSFCPRCNYRISSDDLKCPKCLLMLNSDWSQTIPVKSTISVRQGYDAFIRHPHANNRAYKADRNAGGDKTGEIGVWGGPCTLRYLVKFDIDTAMDYYGISFSNFNPKKALLYISAIKNKSEIEMPVVVFPLVRGFTPGYDVFRTRERNAKGCTWYNATTAMPWKREGGDFEKKCFSRGVIKSGCRNVIDVTEVIKYFYKQSKDKNEWDAPGLIIMSDPSNPFAPSGFVTIYSLDSDDYSLRPELFIQ